MAAKQTSMKSDLVYRLIITLASTGFNVLKNFFRKLSFLCIHTLQNNWKEHNDKMSQNVIVKSFQNVMAEGS